jgi:cholesterol transport system auxiliary component
MRRALAPLAALLLAACAGLAPSDAPQARTFVLEAQLPAARETPARGPALVVGEPRARAGFDTTQMAYVRRPHELEYFARNRWADTPTDMLAPLLAQALERAGCWRSVVQAPNGAPAELHLDSELVRLVQDFTSSPSRVRLTLRVTLSETASGRVLATRELDEIEAAPSEDPYGGVLAANRALERLLGRLAELCTAR